MGVCAKIPLLLLIAVSQTPIWTMLIYAFNGGNQSHTFTNFSFKWILEVLQNSVATQSIVNSLLLSLSASTISMCLALFIIYMCHMQNFASRWAKCLQSVFKLISVTPEMFLAILFFLAIIKANAFCPFAILGSRITVAWFGSIVFLAPSMIAIMDQLRMLDRHIFEAAQDLGATSFFAFWRCQVQIIRMPLMGIWLVGILWLLDDFMIAMLLGGNCISNLQTFVYAVAQEGSTPFLNAVAIVALLSFLLMISIILFLLRFRRNEISKYIKKSL